jgi:hypothetical protein
MERRSLPRLTLLGRPSITAFEAVAWIVFAAILTTAVLWAVLGTGDLSSDFFSTAAQVNVGVLLAIVLESRRLDDRRKRAVQRNRSLVVVGAGIAIPFLGLAGIQVDDATVVKILAAVTGVLTGLVTAVGLVQIVALQRLIDSEDSAGRTPDL